MPDPTHDPIRQLQDFTAEDLVAAPLDPARVRRLGDHRRARRHTAYAAACVAVVVAVAVPVALTAGGGDVDGTPPVVGTPSPPPTVITWPNGGVEVTAATDTSKLEGTTEEFKRFIAAAWQADADQGCASATVTVHKYSTAGYALGGVGGCGGYVALWVDQDGHWTEALGTQDEWRCGDLSRFDVPAGFAGGCYGPSALFGPTDDDGLRLGMSRDEVEAAGGTVTGSGNGCASVFPPGVEPRQDSTLGYLSGTPGKGVVALYAQRDQVTPQGISTSSTRAQVEKAYPDGHLDSTTGAWFAPISDQSYYRFDFDRNLTTGISLVAEGQDCYE